MKKTIVVTVLFAMIAFVTNAQSVFGKWKTIDDKTGKESSIIEIYKKGEKAYGKVVDIIDESKKENICTECSGKNKDKPIMGMVIVDGLKKDGNEWSGGKILDPKNGKKYKCYITLENENKLKVRGYIGFSLLGRTQYWHRVTE